MTCSEVKDVQLYWCRGSWEGREITCREGLLRYLFRLDFKILLLHPALHTSILSFPSYGIFLPDLANIPMPCKTLHLTGIYRKFFQFSKANDLLSNHHLCQVGLKLQSRSHICTRQSRLYFTTHIRAENVFLLLGTSSGQ